MNNITKKISQMSREEMSFVLINNFDHDEEELDDLREEQIRGLLTENVIDKMFEILSC